MSVPSVVKGTYFDVAVSLDNGATWTTICGLTTRNLTLQVNTSDEFLRDCADPTQVPYRVINATGQQADIAGTGLYNRAQGDLIRTIIGKSLPYRYIMGEDASDSVDSGYFQGNFVLSNLQVGAADGSNTTAQFTFVSDGVYSWTPGADIVVLDPLLLSPRSATHGVAYSGTVTGLTTGSTLTATSSDSTALTVSGTGATRTIAGTFNAAGSPTITLNEALTGAINTPRQTKTAIAVA